VDSNGLLEVWAPFPAVLQGQRPDKTLVNQLTSCFSKPTNSNTVNGSEGEISVQLSDHMTLELAGFGN